MKKILFALAALAIGVSASAKTADELRIYINPGHGSWTPNDRPSSTIREVDGNVAATVYSRTGTDTTAFFESNTNLRKGFGVLESLRAYGLKFDATLNQTGERWQIGAARDMSNNIVMSHVKCGPFHEDNGAASQLGENTPADLEYYNRSLSEISAEVDANNFDMFISIHSNAATEGTNTNYPLFLYRGYDKKNIVEETGLTIAHQETSIAMADACWAYWFANPHMSWTYYSMTNKNIRGDISFMGESFTTYPDGTAAKGYYGVLRHHCPGFLVEGYFHTYQPGRHKAMNFDASYLEGVCYAHGIADYFELAKETTGHIYGVVRDEHETFNHDYFKPNVSTDDKFLHLNGVKVILKKDGVEVANYTTDNFYNGIFVFKNVEPGKYTLQFEHAQYLPLEQELEVEVKAADIVYPSVKLCNKDWTPPAIVYENYPDILNGVVTPGGAYALNPVYTDVEIPELAGKTIRRTELFGKKLYVLAIDEANAPTVLVYDTEAQTATPVSTEGVATVESTILPLADIQVTADGVLVATSKSKTHYNADYASQDGLSARGEVYIYKWANDATTGLPTGAPELWFKSTGSANQYIAHTGDSFIYDGTIAEGMMLITSSNGHPEGTPRLWYQQIAIIEGQNAGETFQRPDGTGNYTTTGNEYQIYLSPMNEEQFIISGNNAENAMMNFWVGCDAIGFDSVLSFLNNDNLLPVGSVNRVGFFKFAGKSYMVAPDNRSGANTGLLLIDVTDGIDKATLVTTLNTTLASAETLNTTAAGIQIAYKDDLGEVHDPYFELVLTRDNKISKFTSVPKKATTVTPADNGSANPFAYGLKTAIEGNNLTFAYALNAAATEVIINVKDAEGTVVKSYPFADQAAGEYTSTVSLAELELEDGDYTWEIAVKGAEKTGYEVFFAESLWHPRGLDVDNNMESDAFGTIYVLEGMLNVPASNYYSSGSGAGLYAFEANLDPIRNPNGGLVFTGGLSLVADPTYYADPSRIRVAQDGRIFITRSNSAGSYINVVANHEDLVTNDKWTSLMGEYTFNATSYEYTDADGNFIAAANVGLDVQGAGEDLELLALSANNKVFGFNTGGARVDNYALGTADVLPAPTLIEDLSYLMIAPQCSNVAFDPNSGGKWFCQYRGTPSDTQPALAYVNADGELKLFEGDGGLIRGGGGIRFSPDGSQVAIASSKSQFTIYDLLYDAEGAPTLIANTTVNHGIGTNCYDIAWDLAGNIYVCGNSGEWIKGFAMPRSEAFTTKAPSKYGFTLSNGGVTGVESVEVSNDVPAVYYNLQGVQVANPENGVYIVVRGNKVTKEFIK